ncbi:MAG: type IV secretory system conjugative DNA transfer family protein [Pseudomonadota bacterium]
MALTDRRPTPRHWLKSSAAFVTLAMVLAGCGAADDPPKLRVDLPTLIAPDLAEPLELTTLQELAAEIDEEGLGPVLFEGLRDSAMALGAQAALARRSFQINAMLERHETELNRIFQLQRLAIAAPDGSIVIPPIVTESVDHYRVSGDGQVASSAETIYRITAPGRIVTTMPNWRDYLVRTWEEIELPPPEILPKTDEERTVWRRFIAEGWKEGVGQAEDIFEADLARLERDVAGMVRYRSLVAQGILSEMYFGAADRGITGGGNELKIGDRVVRITVPARLNERSDTWTPVVVRPKQ